MTIDDELILELMKANRLGEVGDEALINNIVRSRNITYKLEESLVYWKTYSTKWATGVRSTEEELRMTPDIIVTALKEGKEYAIELENDIHWDFQESLRQVKKYKSRFKDTIVIIPNDYKRFAPLYKNQEIRVFLWKAKRKWQCLRCSTETVKEGPVVPKCSKCQNHSQSAFRLIGLKDTKIEEFLDSKKD